MPDITSFPGPSESGEFKRLILSRLSHIGREVGEKGKTLPLRSTKEQAVNPQKDLPTQQKASLLQRTTDQVQFSSGMKSQIKQLRREAIRLRYFRDDLESKLMSFLKIDPSLEEVRQAARFASYAIWDIIKKARKKEEDDEISTRLLAMLMRIHSQYTFEHSERV